MNAQITAQDIAARAFDLLEDGKTYSAADLQALRERAEAELRGELAAPVTQTAAERYGVDETNGLMDGHAYHAGVDYADQMTLGEFAKAGGKITRVRILTGSWGGVRMADISYIHGVLPSGKTVPLRVGVGNGTPMWGPRGLKAQFIAWGKEEGVFAKGIGLLDEANWSVLNG